MTSKRTFSNMNSKVWTNMIKSDDGRYHLNIKFELIDTHGNLDKIFSLI